MKLSIIIPTYNCAKILEKCLSSIYSQDFPKKDFEVIIIDGYSTDNTEEVAKKFPVKLLKTHDPIEEPRRIFGIKKSKGDILFFPDSDNYFSERGGLKKLMAPFKDNEIAFSEPLYYSFRKDDPVKIKYHGLIGGDDPLAMYLGLYNRWSYITNNWTGYP